jgi:hypothetical protein
LPTGRLAARVFQKSSDTLLSSARDKAPQLEGKNDRTTGAN